MSSRFESLTGVVDGAFPEYAVPPEEPMDLLGRWVSEAVESGVREPLALALATADKHGRPSSRTVSVIDVSARGLLFTSHSTSQKGREIAETGWASGLLYWRETGQQLAVSGPVVLLEESEADRLWDSRPVPLHSMSTASWQSEPLDDIALLQAEADRLSEGGSPLPRPARYTGYRLEPDTVEFWSAAEDRLHRRLRYDRTPEGWRTTRLQP
ncbi:MULTISPECIES: phenazine biosynthesis FMN-dependent oxidase PhzG [unclassified Streptomyces]|uniref:phenazine biosynthesis FMN-dependent oxidase PhzG n=1 Tax=unclassified Streptomyces TaxID=2593676 RepID=UPI002E3293AD|nr:phenazine biosynthesis FMN-dependent oxidase PhzG [Streptomyces sp. NBC_01460]WSS29379.1 phenazine biosynthesis FMN-dependent oxidase PhzG [Streptomyces sp. NBC_01185]